MKFDSLLVGFGLALGMAAIVTTSSGSASAADVAANPVAVSVIEKFLEALVSADSIEDAAKRVVAAKLVHQSLVDTRDPTTLNADKMRFSFKKAYGSAKLYQAKITRVAETSVTAVGYKETAQKGKLYKYFVAKKDGVSGMPAPLQIFFPDGDGPPVLYDFGSL